MTCKESEQEEAELIFTSKQQADLIFSKLFSKEGENRSNKDTLSIIESVIIDIVQEQRIVGRNQILNHIED